MDMDSNTWNHFIKENGPKSGSFLQSWGWGEFQKSLGRKVIRIFNDNFAAQIIKTPLKFGFEYFYIPKGPIINKIRNSKFEIRNILDNLMDLARKEKVVFIRFEPEFINEKDITEFGIQKSLARQIQPNQTIILNLEKSFEELLSEMHPKTRYNIKLAERHGVEIRNGNGFGEFLQLLKKTAERNNFALHPLNYYKKMLESLSASLSKNEKENDLKIKLWTAKYQNQTIAANLIGYFGDVATYLHGASSYNYRHLMAPHLLHWKIIKDAKISGFKYYDFWGIDEKKWPGVTRFKKGFDGDVISYPGAFDLPIRKNWYKIYKLARRLKSF